MYLLFLCLIGIAAACQKNKGVIPGNSGSQEIVSADAPSRIVDPDDFVAGVNNPFFTLTPGTTFHYFTTNVHANVTEYENVDVTVTNQTKVIQGVTCMVVHDVVSWNGALIEDTYDWYAQDADGNVWYFGEDSKTYDSTGNYVTTGSWEAGVDGAEAGYIMWANPRAHLGKAYRQEYYPGFAEDKGKVVNGHANESVPYGSFQNCIKIKEWSPLHPGEVGFKYYEEGVGQLSSYVASEGESSVLISITQ